MWINVDKKMPEHEEEVVFLEPYSDRIDGTKHIGFFDGEMWRITETDEEIIFVSHWMELPETAHLVDELDKSINMSIKK